jgi:hypothetical protein
MSKQNPNQDHYKIGGRSQSDGPDRSDKDGTDEKQELRQSEQRARESQSKHPAVMRAKRK